MDNSEILEKLSTAGKADADEEFSLSHALALPVDFLISFVRNRRETELLLKVAKSAASLDSLMKNYEIIAVRTQELKEAWDALWLSQEPYVTPAIPLIGCEMSGINRGRSILLQKMEREILHLQEMGKLLHHYIDVNYSLVEELRMEGIDRLATNKLLLVAVEKELVRRITCICNNESMRDVSSIRHFLSQLIRSPTSTLLTLNVLNQSGYHFKGKTDVFSKAEHRKQDTAVEDQNLATPASQICYSKCVAADGNNVKLSSDADFMGMPIPSDSLPHAGWFLDLPTTSSKEIPAGTNPTVGDITHDVRNHSSSASEERLPSKSVGNVPDELPQGNVVSEVLNCIKKQEKNQYGFPEAEAEQTAGYSRMELTNVPINREKGIYNQHPPEGITDKVSPSTRKQECLASPRYLTSNFNHEQEKFNIHEVGICGHLTANLPQHNGTQLSKDQGLYSTLEEDKVKKSDIQIFHVPNPEVKGDVKKRSAETAHSVGDSVRQSEHLEERNSKRIMVNAMSESENTNFPRKYALALKVNKSSDVFEITKHNEGMKHSRAYLDSKGSCDKELELELVDNSADSNDGTSLIPCSFCHQRCGAFTDTASAVQSSPLTQGKCRDCGCSPLEMFNQKSRDTISKNAPLNLACQKGNEKGEPFGNAASESPILATQ